MSEKVTPLELWGVWSEDDRGLPEWYAEKTEAIEQVKNLVAESFGVRVHLYKAVSVGTIEVSAVPVTTGEMAVKKSPPKTAGAVEEV